MPIFKPKGDLLLENPVYKKFPSLIFQISRKSNLEAIERYLVNNNIEAVLCEYGPSGVAMMETCKKLKIPLFVYFHGYDVYRQKELKKYGKKYLELFKISRKIFVVSKDMQNRLSEMGAPPEKLVYNPCGAETELFLPCNPAENPPVLFAAGRFEETKAPQNTIRSFASVARKFPDAKLIMAGEGSLLNKCKDLVKELKIENNVEFLGVLSHKEIAEQMRKSRAFVQHSVTTKNGDKEGTPVAIMEAAACALPVISTRHGGIPDVVVENVTGILVNEHDIESMTEAMIMMIAVPETALKMGMAGFERIRGNFSQKKSIEKLWVEIEKELQLKTK